MPANSLRKDIDWAAFDRAKAKGISTSQIARNIGITPQALRNRAARRIQSGQADNLLCNKKELESFKENRADILASIVKRILDGITPEKIEKAPVGTLALAACQLTDKERLERGQSTSNVSLFAHTTAHAISDLKGRYIHSRPDKNSIDTDNSSYQELSQDAE